MATLAAYPEWYERSGNIVTMEDITEVAVVGSYVTTGKEVASWNAASEGSIMCHIVGTKLFIVWGGLTEIPSRMFSYFILLEKITGLGSVTIINDWAFYRCHSLKSVDLIPEKLTKIGEGAFMHSSTEDALDVSKLPANVELGANATRRQRWGDELTAIQSMEFPKKRIFLDVPNHDSQLKDVYKEVPFITDENTGEVTYTLYDGCSKFGLYHTWNALHAGTSKAYPDMLSWWNATLNADGKYAETTHFVNAYFERDCATLGWEHIGYEQVVDSSQLSYILDELSHGLPVYVGITTRDLYHGIVIIGCEPVTRKLAYVDSGIRYDRGTICWVAYEDIFIGGANHPNEGIYKIDFNVPMLASGSTWFTQGGTTVKRANITDIEIVREYTPSGNETASWDASAEKNRSVMAYVNGTKLTIAGNGYYAIWANPNSSYAFADSAKKDNFKNVWNFNGLPLLNVGKATDITRIFCFCGSQLLSSKTPMYFDVANWNVSNVTSMGGAFIQVPAETLPIDDWDVSSSTNFADMFTGCLLLRELDLSKWVVSDNADTSYMLYGNSLLEKVTLGERFKVDHTDYATFDVTNAEYIPYADGNWYDSDYNAYAPAEIPSNVARTYYASKFIAADDDDTMVFVRNGTLRKMAVALRHKSGKTDTMLPSEFAEAVLALE